MPDFELKVPFLYVPARVDAYLAKALGGRFSRRQIQAALDQGRILLNGRPAKAKFLVREGDAVAGEVVLPESNLAPEPIPLRIVYEDAYLMVVDKPAGMVVHPGAGNKKGTLVHALLGRGGPLSDLSGRQRPGIVHRLDKDTSGLLLVAKDNDSHRKLQAQFASRTLSKTYTALVRGRVEFQEGHVSEPIGRHVHERRKMAVSRASGNKEAETHYRVIRRYDHSTLVELKPVTGRTHQIRVHMAHLGHPVVGDPLYGRRSASGRLGLHASKIRFVHPANGKRLQCESPLPEDFKQMIAAAESH